MAIVRSPSTVERGLRAEFQRMMAESDATDPLLDAIMLSVTSTTPDEKYAWLETIGPLVEIKDHVEVDAVFDSNFTVPNRTFAKVFSITRNDLNDDQVGGAMNLIRSLTLRGRLFPQKLLLDTIISGDTETGYDGQPFFSTTHVTGDSGTQSNLLTGTGTTLALLKDDFDTSIEEMMAFNDASGNPMHETDVNFRPLIIAPTSLWGSFRDLQNAAIINNTTNTIKGTFDLVASPRLNTDDVNDWYMFDMGGVMKPFIKQTRDPLEFQSLTADSDIGFIKEEYLYKIRWRGNVGLAFWQKATKTTNA